MREVPVTTFADNRIRERDDLQRLLRSQIEIICKDTLVVAEEFGDWDGSSRRIDLLGIDRDANLVVIEIKRTEDGGHMELQALRYAAMVSTMTFEKVEEIYADHLAGLGRADDARKSILDFLGWDDVDPKAFAQKVRIILISAEFGKELTTSVMWLNEQGLDIRCVRIKPYLDGGRILVDIQQIIPLPEATEYIVGIRKKQDREREARESARDYTKYDLILGGTEHSGQNKRSTIFKIVRFLCDSGVTPEQIFRVTEWSDRRFRSAEGIHRSSEEFLAWQRGQEATGGKPFDSSRYFIGDDELIHSGDKTWALSNQWSLRTFKQIDKLIEEYSHLKIVCRPSTPSS